ncbi:hypothetical protein KO317_01700 [Candidatus Micrarchaeota archaeon]|nr:hypothetical protein [Candidatus Micrarchaeota archaeon]
MGFNGLTTRQLKRIDNERIKELKILKNAIKSKKVIVDPDDAKKVLADALDFANRPHLTGSGGYKRNTKNQMIQESRFKPIVNIKLSPEPEEFEIRKQLYTTNEKALKNIKKSFYNEEKPGILIRLPLNLIRIGAPIYVVHYFWTNVPKIETLIGLPSKFNENFLIKTAGVILGTSLFILGRIAFKEIKRRKAFNTEMKAYKSREFNPMFKTASYLTRRKRKQAIRLIAKIENLLEKTRINTEKQKEKMERKEYKKRQKEIRDIKKEIRAEQRVMHFEEKTTEIIKNVFKKAYCAIKQTSVVIFKTAGIILCLSGSLITLIPYLLIRSLKAVVREINEDTPEYEKNKIEKYSVKISKTLFDNAVKITESIFNK